MFRNLGLSEQLLRVIDELEFASPSEIQEKAIPLVLSGRDVIGNAATGSGKTLAFGAGIIEKVKKNYGVQALVMVPTRELAEQVADSLRTFSRNHGLYVQEVYGGVGIEPQIRGISRAEIVVGTPGRLLDHLERRTLTLQHLKMLVLDEADRMVDMGFLPDVERVLSACPQEKQMLLFSATTSQDVAHISKKYMKNPIVVTVESYVDRSKLVQTFYDVPSTMKFSLLVHFLKEDPSQLVMVFCNTRRNADMVCRNLQRVGLKAAVIHGGLSQNKRNSMLALFEREHVRILVCTDVASRGLDIEDVSHVYNYDIPPVPNDYIHRIGRTARAGKEGKAINLVSDRDYGNFRAVLDDDSLHIKEEQLPQMEQVSFFVSHDRDRGRGDSRGGRFGRDRGHQGGGYRQRGDGQRGRRDSGRPHGGGRGYGGGRSYGGSRGGSRQAQPMYASHSRSRRPGFGNR